MRKCCGSDDHKEHNPMCSKAYSQVIAVGFSGGRTSAFMRELISKLDKYKRAKVFTLFCNTGKENEPTLQFVDRCDKEFGWNVVWLEGVIHPEMGKGTTHKIVSFDTAARNGEPYRDMVAKYGLPSKAFPHCTRELKLRPVESYMRSLGIKNYVNAVGIRADEKNRVKKRTPGNIYPLMDDLPVDKAFVRNFWKRQSFDLDLKEEDGNCDLCFKKSLRKKLTVIQKNPKVADWWQDVEECFAGTGAGGGQIFNARDKLSVPQLIERAQLGGFEPFTEETVFESQEMDLEWSCICKSS